GRKAEPTTQASRAAPPLGQRPGTSQKPRTVFARAFRGDRVRPCADVVASRALAERGPRSRFDRCPLTHALGLDCPRGGRCFALSVRPLWRGVAMASKAQRSEPTLLARCSRA